MYGHILRFITVFYWVPINWIDTQRDDSQLELQESWIIPCSWRDLLGSGSDFVHAHSPCWLQSLASIPCISNPSLLIPFWLPSWYLLTPVLLFQYHMLFYYWVSSFLDCYLPLFGVCSQPQTSASDSWGNLRVGCMSKLSSKGIILLLRCPYNWELALSGHLTISVIDPPVVLNTSTWSCYLNT